MPLAPLLAEAITPTTVPAKSIFINGLDVALEAGAAVPYGVPIESVEVVESGPDGVSSMSFDIRDLQLDITIIEGAIVRFYDNVQNAPLFLGFIQSWSHRPLRIGRITSVRCVGVEALLDWMIVPSLTIVAGTLETAAIQSVLANAIGVGFPINAIVGDGTAAQPIESLGVADLVYDVVLDGMTVRQALTEVNASAASDVSPPTAHYALITIDSYGGLRYWIYGSDTVVNTPLDWTSLNIIDTVAGGAGSAQAHDFSYETDAGGVAHQVYVTGGNALGTGLVSDGTGLPGPVASLNDDTILTAAVRDSKGIAYLNTLRTAVRGSVTIEAHTFDLTPASQRTRAGGRIVITDANLGLTTTSFRPFSITKTFNPGGTENWTIAFGGHAKSAIQTTRRLTRSVLS